MKKGTSKCTGILGCVENLIEYKVFHYFEPQANILMLLEEADRFILIETKKLINLIQFQFQYVSL